MLSQITNIGELYRNQGEPKTGNQIVDEVVDYLKRSSSHSAKLVAEALGVEQRWLTQSMQIFVGLPLKQFVLMWRTMQAMDLLDDESISLQEVARRTGYANLDELRMAVERIYHTTPFTYRNGQLYRNALYKNNRSRTDRNRLLDHTEALKKAREQMRKESE